MRGRCLLCGRFAVDQLEKGCWDLRVRSIERRVLEAEQRWWWRVLHRG